jgi:hypothetical protein
VPPAPCHVSHAAHDDRHDGCRAAPGRRFAPPRVDVPLDAPPDALFRHALRPLKPFAAPAIVPGYGCAPVELPRVHLAQRVRLVPPCRALNPRTSNALATNTSTALGPRAAHGLSQRKFAALLTLPLPA